MFASNLELIQHRNTFSCVKMHKKKFPLMGLGKGLRVHLPQDQCTTPPTNLDPQPLEKNFPLMGL
jgi:hypothetical protein